jgi:hypothetical protein
MIFSNSFLGLPEQFKKVLLRKLKFILEKKEGTNLFSYLSNSERKNILHILSQSIYGFSNI